MKRLIKKIGSRYAQYRHYRATLNELRQLSDRELWDIGLDRASLIHVAREHAGI